MYKTVYLNAKTDGRTVDGLDYVNYITDNLGSNTKAAPAGLILRFIVCGNE